MSISPSYRASSDSRRLTSARTEASTRAAAAESKTSAGLSALTTAEQTLTFEHGATGREVTRRLGEALTLTHTWDSTGRLTGQTLTGPTARTLQHRAYAYRADGCLTAVEDQLNGPRTFDLDTTGRVTAVHARDWTERYAYDEAGNQTSAQWPSTRSGSEAVGIRTYTGTRITRAGSIRYEHDAQGRIVLRPRPRPSRKPDTWRYEWDSEDRLTSVTTPDGTVWRYLYDPFGRRIAKQRIADDGTVLERTDFTWDGATLAEQTTTSAQPSRPTTLTWDHNGLRPLAQTERTTSADASEQGVESRFHAIVTGPIGTPSELVGPEGALTWRHRTTLWGAQVPHDDRSTHCPLGFPGQYIDSESGLHYNFYRYYDPVAGLYCSPDPLGLAPAPNPRTYVVNPLTWADPLGLAPPCNVDPTISESTMKHVLHGDIRDGQFGGWHLFPGDDPADWPEGRFISGTFVTLPSGTVLVEGGIVGAVDEGLNRILKNASAHTFFPRDWGVAKIAEAGNDLFRNGRYRYGASRVDRVHDGVRVVGFLEKGADGIYRPSTFFPQR